jgi:hypothetical protein
MLVMLASHASECSTKGTEVKRKQKQEMDWQLANLLQKRQDWQHDADVVRGLAIDRQVKRKRGFIDAFEGCSARVRQFKPYILKQVTWYAYHYKIQHHSKDRQRGRPHIRSLKGQELRHASWLASAAPA